MERNGKLLDIVIIFVLTSHFETSCGDISVDQPLNGLEASQNTTDPSVFMANASVTLGEFEIDSYVVITIVRSEALDDETFVDLDLSYNDRRLAFLSYDAVIIPANGTTATTRLVFLDVSDLFFTHDSIYNITINFARKCDVTNPRSTIITVKPERSMTLSFQDDYSYAKEPPCDGCCYDNVVIRSNVEPIDEVTISLLTGSTDTAHYNEDYSLDKQYLDPHLTVNLSIFNSNHYAVICIKRDVRLEGTEFFHLRFNEETLPERVFVGSRNEIKFDILDADTGFIRIENSSRYFSEDIGTIEVTVETDIIQDNESLTLNVTMEPTFSPKRESATPGEDYVPFAGVYVLPPGARSVVIPITIINDDLAELEERLAFKVETHFMNNSYDDFATINIDDDETRNTSLVFSFDTKFVTINESSGILEVYLRATIKNEGYVYLHYIPVEENGLTEYKDYMAYFNPTIKQELFQFDGTTEHKIEVNIFNDCDVEMTEMMVLNISDVSIGQVDTENYNLTITVEDNDKEGVLNCPACSCGGGMLPTEQPIYELEPEVVMLNFELNELEIYEGELSFYDINVVASRATNATVFIGIQPWELEYGVDFAINAKKLVFENNDRQSFSFRALQDTIDEDVESALINIAYTSDGTIGPRNTILIHVLNKKGTTSEINIEGARNLQEPSLKEAHSDEIGSTAITTGLVVGLISSLLVVMVITILFGLAVVIRKTKKSS